MNDPVQTSGKLPGPNERCWCGSGQKYKRCHLASDQAPGGPQVLHASKPSRAGTPARHERRVRPGRLSARRLVPDSIPKPDYAASGRPRGGASGSEIKTPEQIARMRRACRAAAEVLQAVAAAVRPGITTDELDELAHAETLKRGGYPSPLNYHGYPKSLCTSVNEVICHGIPDSRALEDGDIVNLDVTVFLDGMHGDTSATYLVGKVDGESRRLVRLTEECLQLGIDAVRPGRPFSDIGRAIEQHAKLHNLGVVRAYCGHGIGERFHSSLQIPHFFDPTAKRLMEAGMTFTIEPMITLGTWEHEVWDDGWTAVTADGKRTAQFEHTVLVTDAGAEILTRV